MTGFRNPIIGGGGALIRPAIHSPNYDPGVSGWTINKDGTAEFADADIRGSVTSGPTTGSHIILDPDVEVGFNDGFLEAVVRMFPEDPNYMMEGMLGVVTFAEGQTNAEMATVLHSPVLDGGHGHGLVLAAQADDFSRDAHASIGPITAEGDAMTYTGIHMFEDYGITSPAHLSYPGTPGQVVETFQTPGAFSWTAPVGVTSVTVECWGGGGAGANKGATQGGGGGGGGEYVRRLSAAVVPGNTYNGVVGAGGATAGANGGDTSLTTAASTTTAHGGSGASNQTGGVGGTGATVGTHHNGGNGGSTAFGSGGGGGGGAGTNAVGSGGAPGDSHGFGGAGGAGGSLGGGTGGKGGNSSAVSTGSKSGGLGGPPGGGGGGSGNAATSQFGSGGAGQIRLTYTPTVIPIGASMAAEAGTDRFGNSFPAGFMLAGAIVPDATLIVPSEQVATPGQAITTSRAGVTGMVENITTKNPNAWFLIFATWDITVSVPVAGTGQICIGEVMLNGVVLPGFAVRENTSASRGTMSAVFFAQVNSVATHNITGNIRQSGTATCAISAGTGTKLDVLCLDMFV